MYYLEELRMVGVLKIYQLTNAATSINVKCVLYLPIGLLIRVCVVVSCAVAVGSQQH